MSDKKVSSSSHAPAGGGAADRPMPRPAPKAILCPYCGEVSKNVARCVRCGGRFDHLSRQASQNSMGPWQIRDDEDPFRPGCSFETLKRLIAKGKVTETTVLRGPSTRQFWSPARRTPSVANLFGLCHGCQGAVDPDDTVCPRCGASFEPETDRQYLGLMPVRLLPGQAPAEAVAASTYETSVAPGQPVDEKSERAETTGGGAGGGAGVRFEHSMNGVSGSLGATSGERMDGEAAAAFEGRRAWLILALVMTFLCIGTAAGVLLLAPRFGLELPHWTGALATEDDGEVPVATAGGPSTPQQSSRGDWDGLVRPGIDVGSARDEAASRRRAEVAPMPGDDQAGGDQTGGDAADQEGTRAPKGAGDLLSRVRALIAAGDTESLQLARTMLPDLPAPERASLDRAIDRMLVLGRISDIL